MIRVRGLRKSFGARQVLRGIDLEVSAGSISGIAGPNACGKSTLMKCLLGLVVPDSGEIWVGGRPIDAAGEFRRSLGYMPQNPQFPENLKGRELLEMLQDLRRESAASKDNLVSYFELGRALQQPVSELSGGTKQKLAAVMAMMFSAPVILLDEPTAGMDPLISIRFKELLLREAKAGKCILLISHLVSEIEQLASSITFLHEGEAVFSGTHQELLARTGAQSLELALTKAFEEREK